MVWPRVLDNPLWCDLYTNWKRRKTQYLTFVYKNKDIYFD